MTHRGLLALTAGALGAWLLAPCASRAQTPAEKPAAPRILYDTSPRAVEYQLSRLSNDELARVDRKEDDAKFRPVYVALLTRKGLGREYFDEALGALTKMDKASRAEVLLAALPKVRADDTETADKLLRVLFAEPADMLRAQRAAFARAAEQGGSPAALRGAYGGLIIADGDPQAAWKLAASREGHLVELLRSVPLLGRAPELQKKLAGPLAAYVADALDPPTKAAALAALAWARPDQATFALLAREVVDGSDPELRATAVRSLQTIPRGAWPPAGVDPLARAIVALAAKTPAERRTDPAIVEAIQLAESLAEGLAEAPRRALRRELRDLGVQIIRIEALPEKMEFDLKWFVVEAGKPVQIVLFNPDAMSHNLLVGKPGSVKDIGMAASTMTVPTDPKVKPYVPDSPLVLQATRLLNWGETDRLNFIAPKAPGEYVYVCTFPGHWVRMYGVMLVVENLEAWEAKPTVPVDPMTGKPYPARR